MKSRLFIFLVSFALVVGAFEGFARVNGKHFYALSDKVLLRAEILERSPETEVLFIGSSRFMDAIDHERFTQAISERAGREIKCFNGAATGFDGGKFAYFSKIAAENEHLTHVILEASSPSLQDGEVDFPNLKAADSTAGKPEKKERKAVFADTVEAGLQEWVTDHVALVKYRKSLRPQVLPELLVLFTAGSIDPNIWSRKGIVRNLFTSSDFDIAGDFATRFQPDVITPKTLDAMPKNLNPNHIYENLETISEIFANSGKDVIWVAPPVSREKRKGNYSAKFTRYYGVIAHRFGSTFYDYTGLDLDEEFLRDSSHLNAKGRELFSTFLAEQLADHF